MITIFQRKIFQLPSSIPIFHIPSYHSNISISSDCPQCHCQPHLIYFRTQAHSAQSLSPYKWPTVHNATFNCWNLKILAFQIHMSYWIEVWYFSFGVYIRKQLNVKAVNKDRRRTERSPPSRGIRPPFKHKRTEQKKHRWQNNVFFCIFEICCLKCWAYSFYIGPRNIAVSSKYEIDWSQFPRISVVTELHCVGNIVFKFAQVIVNPETLDTLFANFFELFAIQKAMNSFVCVLKDILCD